MKEISYEDVKNIKELIFLKTIPTYLKDILENNKRLRNSLFTKDILTIQINSRVDFLNLLKKYKTYASSTYGNRQLDSNKSRPSFTGTKNYEEYLDMLAGKKTAHVTDFLDKLKIAFKKLHTGEPENYVYDVEGSFFDVAKVLEGEPEAYLRPSENTVEHYANVLIDVGSSGNVSKNLHIENFAKILKVVKALEINKIKTRIIIMEAISDIYHGASRKQLIFFLLKDYKQPFDWLKIAGVFHPSFLRRGIFKIQELLGNQDDDGYGRPWHPIRDAITIDRKIELEKILSLIEKQNKNINFKNVKL